MPEPPLHGARSRAGPSSPAEKLYVSGAAGVAVSSIRLSPAAVLVSSAAAWPLSWVATRALGRRKEEPGAEPLPPTGSQQPVSEDTAPLPPAQPGGTGLKFGLLTPELHAHVLGQQDYRKRTQAVEELKRVIEDASQAAVTSVPAPSILGFIGLLCTLLGDLNFKVVLGALEVICLLALRLDNQVNAFLTALFSAATKVLGDSKPAIRQGYNRPLQWLMKAVGPQQVLDLLLQQEYRQHKNSRVREEVVSMCIVALLTYSSEELDLAKLAFELAPALVDNKHRVRHAAMEAFAVLASAMGPGKTTLLFKAVDAMELEDNGDGLMHAVQARLARKILPKLADQGFVQYAVPLPSSGYSRASCLPPGADTDWLLMCDRIQSSHSYCGYKVGVDALQDSSSHSVGANQVACSRKVWSAFKEKNKLPWEKEHAEDREVGSGVKMHVAKGVEQVCTCTSLDSCVLKDVPKGDVKIVKGLLSDSPTKDRHLLVSPPGENLQEKHAPVQLKPILVRQPAPCRGLNGTKPIPPIPRLLPDKIELNVTKWRNEECKDMRLNKADGKLAAADLSELNVDGEEVDQEEMKNSLRSIRKSAAKKRAELSGNVSGLESPNSAVKVDVSVGSPFPVSCPSVDAYSESGVYSQESLTSPMSTVPHRRRIT
ncbi:TOG array regulator of axonemal microtubules protein 1-like [Amazona ochrocephala]